MATPTSPSREAKELLRQVEPVRSVGFVVRDWTGVKDGDEPVIMVLKPGDIFDFLATVDKTRKIAVYNIGSCVLDWS